MLIVDELLKVVADLKKVVTIDPAVKAEIEKAKALKSAAADSKRERASR